MNYYTYAYLREDRTPYYIGKGYGNRLYRRSKKDIKPPKDKSRVIFLKQNLTEEEAFKHEIYMIDVFGRIDLRTGILHNRTDGGEGTSGFISSPETKAKMSAVRKGKTLSPEHRAKISAGKKGTTLSPETKAKISAANKGRTLSPKTKAKLSAENKGRTLSPETKAKMSAAKKNMTPETKAKMSAAKKNMTPETKAKISAARKGKTLSPETRAKLSTAKKGESNHSYGKIWITDGNINLMIPKNNTIPEGFRKGMTITKLAH